MKIGKYIDIQGGFPASGPLRGTAWQIAGLILTQLIDPPRGRPAGGGGVHPNRGRMGVSTPIIIPEFTDFHGKSYE